MKSVVADPVSSLDSTRIRFGSTLGRVRQLLGRKSVSQWKWAIAACLFLMISGSVRFYRDRQFQSLADLGAVSPFPLSEFPRRLGTWQAVEGADTQLDPEIARVAGSSEHLLRTYQDLRSGQTASVLILYGLAGSVFGHTPEACYPAAGYKPVMDTVDHPFTTGEPGVTGTFRSGFYAKTAGGLTQYVEVFHTFLHRGEWLSDLRSRWKTFRYHPGTFKVQIQRQTSDLSTDNSPSESLLKEIARQIDLRVEESRKKPRLNQTATPRT